MQYIQLQGQVAAGLDTPLAGGFNLFVDAADNTIKVKDSEGNLTGSGISLIEITRAELLTSIDDGALIPGSFYKISGVATGSSSVLLQEGGITIILQAISTSALNSKGFGLFWNPNYDTINVWDNKFSLQMAAGVTGPFFNMEETLNCDAPSDVVLKPNVYGASAIVSLSDYSASDFFTDPTNYPISFTSANTGISGEFISANYTSSYTVGDFAIWGGRVWANLSGNVGSDVNEFELNPEDWQLVPFAEGPCYGLVIDEIEYEGANNHISHRRDARNNISVFYNNGSEGGTTGIRRFPWGHLSVTNVYLENADTQNLVNLHNSNGINGLHMKHGSRFEADYWGRNNDFDDIYGDVDSDIEDLRLGNGTGINKMRLGINATLGGIDPIYMAGNDGDYGLNDLTLGTDVNLYGIELYEDSHITNCVLSNNAEIYNMLMYNGAYLQDITMESGGMISYIEMGDSSRIINVKLEEDAHLSNLNLDRNSYMEFISLGISSNMEYSSVGESCYITDVQLDVDSSINCITMSRQNSYSPYIEGVSLGSNSSMNNINLSNNTYISSVKFSDNCEIGQISISGASGGYISNFEVEQNGGFGSFNIDASAGTAFLNNFKIGQDSGFGNISDVTSGVEFKTISREFNNFGANDFIAGLTGSFGTGDISAMTQLDPTKTFHVLDTTGWDGQINDLNYHLPDGSWDGQTVKFFATGNGINMGEMGGIRIYLNLGTPFNVDSSPMLDSWYPFITYDRGISQDVRRNDVPTAIWLANKWIIDNDRWD
jgi:hypothetical protein